MHQGITAFGIFEYHPSSIHIPAPITVHNFSDGYKSKLTQPVQKMIQSPKNEQHTLVSLLNKHSVNIYIILIKNKRNIDKREPRMNFFNK
jgi:hypothetical protein